MSKKLNFLSNKTAKKYTFIGLMLVWPLLHFAVFWVYMNFHTIMLTFQQLDRFGMHTGKPMTYFFCGLENYEILVKALFFPVGKGGDVVLQNGLLNSLWAPFVNIVILLPLSILFAYVLSFKIKGERIFRTLFYLPNIISIVVLTMLYKYMFNSDFGPLNALFKMCGIERAWFDTSIKSDVIWPIIIGYCLWAGMGVNVILMSSAIGRIPQEIFESCRLDGIGFWKQLFSVVIPLTWSTISTQIVLGTLAMFNFFIQPYLLVGGGGGYEGQTMTLSIYIFNTIQRGNQAAYTHAATLGVLFCAIGTPFIFLIKWSTERLFRDVDF